MAEEKYISLKEAAELSGYTTDYIGQLIRAGKLDGKKIFTNVSWVTTEDAIREYIEKSKKGVTTSPATISFKERILKFLDFVVLYRTLQIGATTLLAIFILLLIYILSVSIDHRINQSYQEQIELGL